MDRNMFRADLHCHTQFSDGSLSPQELITYAKQVGLSGLSITDHDSINAYETAIPIARTEQILLAAEQNFLASSKNTMCTYSAMILTLKMRN